MKENSKVHDCCGLHNDLPDQGKAPATRTDQGFARLAIVIGL
jgi:hypothetical protein